jgi:hypothetical protein
MVAEHGCMVGTSEEVKVLRLLGPVVGEATGMVAGHHRSHEK